MPSPNCTAPTAIHKLTTSTGRQEAENSDSFALSAGDSSLPTPAGKRSRTSLSAPNAAVWCIYIKEKAICWDSGAHNILFAGPMQRKWTNMKCPHLINWIRSACKACDNPYTPTAFQINEYCKSVLHPRCPFYMTRKEIDDKFILRKRETIAIWAASLSSNIFLISA